VEHERELTDPRSLLARALRELRLAATPAQREALLELSRLLDRWSARVNLTGHRGLTQLVGNLVLDSLALLAQIPDVESLADVGSGAGFPGLPAAILRPSCRVTLIESRLKRHHFQRAACRAIAIRNATPLHGRAEKLEPSPHAAVVAQAVAPPGEALGLMVPWLAPGGIAILPGGEHAPRAEHPQLRPERVARYRVPVSGIERSVWIARKEP
jgi:16S rRNA (guanine527-N7)-methyltransferase